MAYDAMGNFTGDYSMPQSDYGMETEEERRRREEEERRRRAQETANAVVESQQVKTYGDGTQEKTVKTTIPAVPVNPADTFNRMVQTESGGQQYNPQGGILTSPAGAQGMAQIMPATARNPGYGVKPATPDEIATPEGNRAFGERYFQGLLQHFGGDQQKAVAAYNAGPGAVGRNVAANQGQLNTGQLPGETQGYLNKVMGGVGQAVNAVMPSAQAGTLTDQQRTGQPTITPPPAAPVAPMSNDQLQQAMSMETAPAAAPQMAPAAPAPAQAPSPYALTAPSGQGLQVPGVTPTAGQPPVAEAQSRFQSIQDNVGELMKLREDTSQPEYLQQRARERAYELMKNEQQKQQAEQKAKELIASGDGSKIADALKGRGAKGEEGSWLKMIMLGYLNPTLAGAEAVKLGLAPTKWATTTLTMPDGTETAVEIQTRADGKVVKGNRMDGTPLTADELGAASAGVLAKGVHVTKTETYIDPASGQIVNHQTLSDGKERYLAGGKSFSGDKKTLVPEKQFTAAEDRRVTTAIEKLRRDVPQPTEQQTYQALIAARVPNRRIEQEMGMAPGTLGAGAGRQGGAAVGGGATITASTTPKNATPAQQQSALSMNDQPPEPPSIREIAVGERKDQYDAYVKQQNDQFKKKLEEHQNAQKLKQKDAEAFNTKRYEVKSTLDKFREGIDIIDKGTHNLGPNFSVSGAGPLPKVQDFFGRQFGTDDSSNTAILRSLITRGGLEGIKNYMGPAISNFDVQTWMKNNPISESSPPEAIRSWLSKTHNAMLDQAESQRTNAVKQGFVEPSFSLGNRIEISKSAGGDNMTPQDRARAELEKRKKQP